MKAKQYEELLRTDRKMRIIKYFFAIFFIFNVSLAYSCSRPPGNSSVEDAYNESVNVYLAFARTIENKEKKNVRGHKYISQEVSFVVLETWKGNKRIGDTVKYITNLDNMCLASVTNDPPWLEDEESLKRASDKMSYVRMSGIWLIYEYSDDTNSLEMDRRTAPLEYGGANDLNDLYALSGRLKK